MHGTPMHHEGHYSEFAGTGGLTALDACCECGGGEGRTQSCKTTTEWKDAAGHDCEKYEGVCDAGNPLESVQLDYFLKEQRAGMSALDACCNCGGGHSRNETCQNTEGWTDAQNFGCLAYNSDACMAGKPLHDDEQYTHYKNSDGVSALDACCHCGGGEGGPMCADMSGWTN